MTLSPQELVIDSFAGGGGASLGIAWALGRAPDIAINHCPDAIAMHAANHPDTHHVREDVWRTDLRRLVGRRPVGLLHASPDCRHFSRAKGGKPVEKSIRSLAWIVCRWAEQVRPRVITMENVREFTGWGPIVPRWRCESCGWGGTEGQATLVRRKRRCPRCESGQLHQTSDQIPDPARQGLTFRRWLGRLRNLGYEVQYRVLDAADYGAPTHRRRLFVVARRDGEPIEWPEPTHAAPERLDDMPLFGRLKPYRTAAECIDWSQPCPSIFGRPKPLADKTLRRIAEGLRRYVLECPEPFIVPMTHAGERRNHPLTEPLPTITGANRGELALVRPFLDRYGLDPARPLHRPPDRSALVAAFLIKYFGTSLAQRPQDPLATVTARDRFGLVLVRLQGQPYLIRDIGLRMLAPRELARAQGFPDTYQLTGTKTSQVARLGNSVCPHVAAALVRANLTAPVPSSAR